MGCGRSNDKELGEVQPISISQEATVLIQQQDSEPVFAKSPGQSPDKKDDEPTGILDAKKKDTLEKVDQVANIEDFEKLPKSPPKQQNRPTITTKTKPETQKIHETPVQTPSEVKPEILEPEPKSGILLDPAPMGYAFNEIQDTQSDQIDVEKEKKEMAQEKLKIDAIVDDILMESEASQLEIKA